MSDQLPFWLYVFVTFTLPVWYWFAHTLDYGNVQEFITWLVAGIALLYAKRAASAAGRTNELQDQQIKQLRSDQLDRDDDKRRDQAEKVAVWCDLRYTGDLSRLAKMMGRERVIAVRNSSELPVFVPIIYVSAPMYDLVDVVEPDIPIPPATKPRMLNFSLDSIPLENQSRPFSAGIYFRDARNNFWHRGTNGVLQALPQEQFFQETDELRNQFQGAITRPNGFDD